MKALGSAFDKVAADRRAMFLESVRAQSEIRALLTADQRKKLDQWHGWGNRSNN